MIAAAIGETSVMPQDNNICYDVSTTNVLMTQPPVSVIEKPMASGQDIAKARAAQGLSQQALADLVGLSQPAIQKIETGETRRSKFLPEIERVLGLSSDASRPDVMLANVRGIVAAGAWLEEEAFAHEEFEPVPYVPLKHTGMKQFAFLIRGDSVDQARLLDGDYAICVDYWETRTHARTDDLVVVERRRAGTVERTCKVLKVTAEGYELWPRSSNPKWQTPIIVMRQHTPDTAEEVEIVALVIGKYSPF